MRKIFISIPMLTPSLAFAAGGYIGPLWLTVLMDLFLLPSLFLFFYIGYLTFRTPKERRLVIVGMYLLAVLGVALVIGSAAYLMSHENIRWMENLCLFFLLFTPVLVAYISHRVNVTTDKKYLKFLRLSWYAAIGSVVMLFVFPFFLMFLQMFVPSLQFFL